MNNLADLPKETPEHLRHLFTVLDGTVAPNQHDLNAGTTLEEKLESTSDLTGAFAIRNGEWIHRPGEPSKMSFELGPAITLDDSCFKGEARTDGDNIEIGEEWSADEWFEKLGNLITEAACNKGYDVEFSWGESENAHHLVIGAAPDNQHPGEVYMGVIAALLDSIQAAGFVVHPLEPYPA